MRLGGNIQYHLELSITIEIVRGMAFHYCLEGLGKRLEPSSVCKKISEKKFGDMRIHSVLNEGPDKIMTSPLNKKILVFTVLLNSG